jgi:hypothetical protein
MRLYPHHAGTYPGPGDRRGYSLTRLLALALPGQSACRRISDRAGRSVFA